MRISAITRFKQGDLWQAIRRLGWTQSELARRCGIEPKAIGKYINLQERPSEARANLIQTALAEAGEYIDVLEAWPETFRGLNRAPVIEQTQEIDVEQLTDADLLKLAAPDTSANEKFYELMEQGIEDLDERDKKIMRLTSEGLTLEQIGRRFQISRERARQMREEAAGRVRRNMLRKVKKSPKEIIIEEAQPYLQKMKNETGRSAA